MPCKTKRVKGAKAQPTLTGENPQRTLTEEQAAANQQPRNDRDAVGKFAAGNRGGPGNPHARHCARMLALFRNCISDEEMVVLIRKLYTDASAGDLSAAKIVLNYKIGKPGPAPLPDDIDRDEWDHFKKDRLDPEEMKSVMGALPTSAGLDIIRTALPVMTAAWNQELVAGLTKEPPVSKETVQGAGDTYETPAEEAPIPNGKTHQKPADRSTIHDSRSTTLHPSTTREPATRHTPPAATTKPISNGKNGNTMERKCGRKKAKALWLGPLAKRIQGSDSRVKAAGKRCMSKA